MRSIISPLLLVSVSIDFVAPAFADNPPARPAFALMDNTGDGSKLNLDVATLLPAHGPGVGFRSSLLGQHDAPNGFGGYAGISTSTLLLDHDVGGTTIGNLELGGLYQRALSSDLDLGIRAGLILPTADDGALLQTLTTLIARPSDLATAAPNATWLRLGISPTYHRGPVFLRADFGLDLPVIAAHETQGIDPIGHINFGIGITDNKVSVTAEFQNLFVTNSNGDDKEISVFHTAGLSARYQGKWASPYLSISTPFNDGHGGEVLTVTAGVSIPF